MGYIFLSYSRRDSQFVDALRSRLESNGIQVWVDRTDIQGGSQWRSEIVKAIEGADSIIVILSPNSIQSDNVRKELDIAESHKSKIIPVEIGRVTIPPDFEYQLAGLQRIEMGNNFDAGFSQLLNALQKSHISNQGGRYQITPTYIPDAYKSVISKYAQLIKDKNIHFLSEIPENKLVKVFQHYAGNALTMNEIPLCLVDFKHIGSGKFGLLVTNQTLYWKDTIFGSGNSISLNNIVTIDVPSYISGDYKRLKINHSKHTICLDHISRQNLKMISSMVLELARL